MEEGLVKKMHAGHVRTVTDDTIKIGDFSEFQERT
jgi:hypothetical protein